MNRKIKKICRLCLAFCLSVSFIVFLFWKQNVSVENSLKFVNSAESQETKIGDLQNALSYESSLRESKTKTMFTRRKDQSDNDLAEITYQKDTNTNSGNTRLGSHKGNIVIQVEYPPTTSKPDLTKIVDVTTIAEKNFTTFPCLTASLGDRSFPICLYTKDEDIWVSKAFYEGGYWEGNLVSKFLGFLAADKDLEFVDIGANVGSYTLPVAHAGFRVIAVEPNTATLQRLAQSIYLGNITQKVILLQNAISNEHSSTILGRDAQNQGNTFLLPTNSCTPITDPNCLSTFVQTILLDDLLPLMSGRRAVIKIDVQGSEIHVFDPRTSFKFFSEVEVEVILMEWEKYIGGKHEESAVKLMLAVFDHRKYVAHDANLKRLEQDWRNWPVDIFFLKGKALENVGLL